MSGWILSLLLAMAAAAALILLARPKGGAFQFIVAALLLGLAGYAWQGRPGLPGHPTPPSANRKGGDTLFAHERKTWLETVGQEALDLDGADAFIRNGDPDYAVGTLRAELMREPNNMMLWLGLGNALQSYADGVVTPPARYAFEHAAALAPRHPAPAYFLGLAYVQEGDLDSAEQVWRGLLDQTPADAPWRAQVEDRLALIARVRGAH